MGRALSRQAQGRASELRGKVDHGFDTASARSNSLNDRVKFDARSGTEISVLLRSISAGWGSSKQRATRRAPRIKTARLSRPSSSVVQRTNRYLVLPHNHNDSDANQRNKVVDRSAREVINGKYSTSARTGLSVPSTCRVPSRLSLELARGSGILGIPRGPCLGFPLQRMQLNLLK